MDIEFLPAARTNDKAFCVAGGPDVLNMGSPNVIINNQNAVRKGDSTFHGGIISKGAGTVEIGIPGDGVTVKVDVAKAGAGSRASGEKGQRDGGKGQDDGGKGQDDGGKGQSDSEVKRLIAAFTATRSRRRAFSDPGEQGEITVGPRASELVFASLSTDAERILTPSEIEHHWTITDATHAEYSGTAFGHSISMGESEAFVTLVVTKPGYESSAATMKVKWQDAPICQIVIVRINEDPAVPQRSDPRWDYFVKRKGGKLVVVGDELEIRLESSSPDGLRIAGEYLDITAGAAEVFSQASPSAQNEIIRIALNQDGWWKLDAFCEDENGVKSAAAKSTGVWVNPMLTGENFRKWVVETGVKLGMTVILSLGSWLTVIVGLSAMVIQQGLEDLGLPSWLTLPMSIALDIGAAKKAAVDQAIKESNRLIAVEMATNTSYWRELRAAHDAGNTARVAEMLTNNTIYQNLVRSVLLSEADEPFKKMVVDSIRNEFIQNGVEQLAKPDYSRK